jgi:uncharacterized protein
MKRLYDAVIRTHFRTENKMLFLSGPRQVGKTTASRAALPDALYLNWDNPEHRAAIMKGPANLFAMAGGNDLGNRPTVIFDELHKYSRWKSFLKGFYDTYTGKLRICVTGSARLDVYKHGGDSLMGRYFHFRVHPLTAGEIADPRPADNDHRKPVTVPGKAWESLLLYGGYPEPYLRNDRTFYNRWKRTRLDLLFNEDVRDISMVTDLGRIRLLAEMIAARAGGMVNYSHLAADLQVSVDTVRRWFDVLESVYYCYRITPYSRKISRSILREPKVYLWDWSLVDDPGARYENFVASHLLKTVHYHVDAGTGAFSLHYLRTKDGREADFLVTRDRKPWLIIEAKSGDSGLSDALPFFQNMTGAPYAMQAVLEKAYVDADCFSHKAPVIVPAKTLLAQLV